MALQERIHGGLYGDGKHNPSGQLTGNNGNSGQVAAVEEKLKDETSMELCYGCNSSERT